jgi:hypothetical protein
MDNYLYIAKGILYWIVQAIPESLVGDTVSVEIKRLSDGYTWNFSTLAFVSGSQTGTMTFISDILWKQSFTPPTEDTYIITVNDETLDTKFVQVIQAVGTATPSGLTGDELTTKTLVKAMLGITTTADDDLLDQIIATESDLIKFECDRDFVATDYTEYYSGEYGQRKLLLNNYPINSITSIHDDIDWVYGTDTLIDDDEYAIDSEGGIVALDGLTFMGGLNNIKVVYNAGYTTIPSGLELACRYRVVAEYLEGKGGVNVFENQEIVYRPKYLKEQAEKILEQFKRVR